jgi:uncharacterized membrane protein YdjX (TVP38/TMEM64 family)
VTPAPLWLVLLGLFLDGATVGLLTPFLLFDAGKRVSPWTLAWAGGAASAAGSMVQLHVLRWLLAEERPWLATRGHHLRGRLHSALERYRNASFLALVAMRATPIPDLPLKLVAAAGGYPIPRYGLAVWLGAIPYYYLIAKAGEWVAVPTWVVGAAAAAVLAVAVGERVWRRRAAAAPADARERRREP